MLNYFIDIMLENTNSIKEYSRLIKLREVIKEKQFVDLEFESTKERYSKFIKSMNNTYIGTISAKNLLIGESHKYSNHSDLELDYPIFNGLSIREICMILDSIDLYTICRIIDKDTKIVESDNNIVLTGMDINNNKFDVTPISLKKDKIKYNKKIINGISAYEMLYRKTLLPIGTILSSINKVNTEFFTTSKPNEELIDKIYEYEELCPVKSLIKKNNR